MTSSSNSVLRSSIALEHRSLWFATIVLHDDEILISGWSWTGRVTERIPIKEITTVERWTVGEGPNFRFQSTNGRTPVFGRVQDKAKFWEKALEKDERVEVKLRH